MIDAGKYRHIIEFQTYNGALDEVGAWEELGGTNWATVRTCHAAIDPVSGREFYAAEQAQSEVSHKIRCRFFSGASPKMRIVFGSRVFHIVSIINWEERGEALLIMAKELAT